ncbi:unnamed protein product [Orchesella dallaii]|uniref:L-Fucosyltransferase n=1 Tax=Orchesella dallaii TaxID=48710 RepID=A0ABP1S564_9HEXA
MTNLIPKVLVTLVVVEVILFIIYEIKYSTFSLSTASYYSYFSSPSQPHFIDEHGNGSHQKKPMAAPSHDFKLETVFNGDSRVFKTFFNSTLHPPGVISTTVGGIGNQLFRYACSYALAKRKGWPVYINVEEGISIRMFQASDRFFVLDKFNIPLDNIIRIGATFLNGSQIPISDEDLLYGGVNDSIASTGFILPGGYCQSEIFWKEYSQDIIKMFQVRTESLNMPKIQRLLDEIRRTESVAVHVRRQDFISTNDGVYFHPTSFHRKAVPLLAKMLNMRTDGDGNRSSPVFFVFSDDIIHAENKLKKFSGQFRIVYVSARGGRGGTSSLEDFFLMTMCKHVIFSNSTFGWWAAYLNGNKGKIVITSSFNPHHYKIKGRKTFHEKLDGTMYHKKEWVVIDPFSGGYYSQ